MIPVIWAVAFAIGRWWVIPLVAVAWPVLLLIEGPISFSDVPLAAALAAANAAPFVVIRWALRQVGESFASRFARAS